MAWGSVRVMATLITAEGIPAAQKSLENYGAWTGGRVPTVRGRDVAAQADRVQTHVRHDRQAWGGHLVRSESSREAKSRQGWIVGIDIQEMQGVDT